MNVIQVDVAKAVPASVPPAFVRSIVRRAATMPEVAARLPQRTSVSIAVRLTDDQEMLRLNREFAREDHATDVLSFAGEGDHLGDLAISWPAVGRQAREHRHPPDAELALLCVHGLLHLLGWDHATAAQAKEMTRITVAALALSGIRLPARRL